MPRVATSGLDASWPPSGYQPTQWLATNTFAQRAPSTPRREDIGTAVPHDAAAGPDVT